MKYIYIYIQTFSASFFFNQKKVGNINKGMAKGGLIYHAKIMLLENLTWKNSQTANKLKK